MTASKKGKLRSISAMITDLDYDKIAIIVETSQRSTSWQIESILNAALNLPAMKGDIQARAFHLIKTDSNHAAAVHVLKSYGWEPPADSAPATQPELEVEAEEPARVVQPVFDLADIVPAEDAPRVRVVARAAGAPGSAPPAPLPTPAAQEAPDAGDSTGARGLLG